MEVKALENRVDFLMLIDVANANPNGDIDEGGAPRKDLKGYGEISSLCIKHKVRMRAQDEGEEVLYQSPRHLNPDGFNSIQSRVTAALGNNPGKPAEQAAVICEKYWDVRAFGATLAYKAKKSDEDGASIGITGAVSIQVARSVDPVVIKRMPIGKSVNGVETEDGKRSSDTIGDMPLVAYGLYVVKGSIIVLDANKTGFSVEDKEKLKDYLRTLFVNDESNARPAGSMSVDRMFWWEHNNKIGQYGPKKVFDSVKITKKDGVYEPTSIDDYIITLDNSYQSKSNPLSCEVIEGF